MSKFTIIGFTPNGCEDSAGDLFTVESPTIGTFTVEDWWSRNTSGTDAYQNGSRINDHHIDWDDLTDLMAAFRAAYYAKREELGIAAFLDQCEEHARTATAL